MTPLADAFGVAGGYAAFWALFILVFGFFARRIWELYRFLRLGQSESRLDQIPRRLLKVVRTTLLQVCSLKSVGVNDRAGIGHALVFWGFLLFFLNYVLYIGLGNGLGLSEQLEGNKFYYGFSAVLDVMAGILLAALVWAAVRRYIVKPIRLERKAEAAIILVLISTLMICHLFLEAFSINVGDAELGSWPLIGGAMASGLEALSEGAQRVGYNIAWWVHFVIVLGFLVYIPYSKHLHLLASFFNIFFSSLKPGVALKTIDLETAENYGASQVTHFSWKQLLDSYACTECGRCQANCPGYLTEKPLYPRDMLLNIKHILFQEGPKLLKGEGANPGTEVIGEVLSEDGIWACTTCRACMYQCPVMNEHITHIVEMRRHLVLEAGRMPDTAQGALTSVKKRGHPWRGTMASRTDWAAELDVPQMSNGAEVDIVYWVGCTSALEDRSMKVAQAMAKLFKAAGVNFGILGAEEACCGDPARRMGEEHLFQMLAQQNIETLKGYQVKKIVTACPHCYHTLKSEYPQFGGEFEVVHHTQFLLHLVHQGKLKPAKGIDKVASYHDSCYLGRYNDIYDEPRNILVHIPGIKRVELERNRQTGFCCGGGGGRMWMEESIGTRINQVRTEEVIKAKADIVATACPYCLQMFEDGIKAKEVEESIKAFDLAELLVQSLAH